MKKISLLFTVVLLNAAAFAQEGVGINTKNPQGTLHVKGDAGTDALKIETNTGNPALTITKEGRVGIGTTAPERGLHVATNDGVHFEGLTQGDTINYRKVLVADDAGNVEAMDYNRFIKVMPKVRSIKYKTKTSPINANCPTNSILEFGKLRIRLNTTSATANPPGNIEFQVTEPNHYSVYWEKAGNGGTATGQWAGYRYFNGSAKAGNINTPADWIPFKMRKSNADSDKGVYVNNNFNAGNRDIVTAIILLNNSKLVYRVTFLGNPALSAIGTSVNRVDASITIFAEELSDYN